MTARRTVTRKSAIAEYWLGTAEGRDRLPGNTARYDCGEPACFACGWIATAAEEPPTTWSVWDRASLQRCHLVPHALGGADAPANLVLLCGRCHAEAPDVGDARYMLAWINDHPSWGELVVTTCEQMLALHQISEDEVIAFNQQGSRAALDVYVSLLRGWSIPVGGKFSYTTLAACAVEAVRRRR